MTLQELLQKIDDWDFYFEMSDDPRIYDEGLLKEKELVKDLQSLSEQDKHIFQKISHIYAHANKTN